MNASEIRFRCSSLGYIMTNGPQLTEKQAAMMADYLNRPQLTDKQYQQLQKLLYKKSHPDLSETCKTHLIDVFVSAKYKRREEISGKYLEKGNAREEDSITLLSRITKHFFKKNDIRLNNDFISGEPDIYLGDDIAHADETYDTKTSWSAHTFFRAQKAELDKMYYWQGQGYMDLTGAKRHTVAYCLVNGTEQAISDEKRKLAYRMGIIDGKANESYKEKCKQIEINHIFDLASFQNEYPWYEFDNDVTKWAFDIPIEERLFMFKFDRNQDDIDKMHKRVYECRDYMDRNLYKVAPEPADFI